MYAIALLAVVFLPLLAEAGVSARHERRLRALGAVEPHGDVFAAMQVVYPASFVAMIVEGTLRGRGLTGAALAGGVLFAAAKALKYWAIASLGVRWTFRVLVPPGSSRTTAGPYRLVRHPNYIAVAGELAGMALLAHAPIAGPIALLVFGSLILARIRIEERAMAGGR